MIKIIELIVCIIAITILFILPTLIIIKTIKYKKRSLVLLEEQNNLIKQEIELLKEKGKN